MHCLHSAQQGICKLSNSPAPPILLRKHILVPPIGEHSETSAHFAKLWYTLPKTNTLSSSPTNVVYSALILRQLGLRQSVLRFKTSGAGPVNSGHRCLPA